MSCTPFIVIADAVQISFSFSITDVFRNGLRVSANGSAVIVNTIGTGEKTLNGLLLDSMGRLIVVDATDGLPSNVAFCNGFPLTTSGELCVSVSPYVTYNNGTPMVDNGAVAVAEV